MAARKKKIETVVEDAREKTDDFSDYVIVDTTEGKAQFSLLGWVVVGAVIVAAIALGVWIA